MPDVVAIGAANVDLVASMHRFPKPDDEVVVEKLEMLGGGSAANVAVGVARLGHSAGFVGLLGTDSFGDFLVKEFEKEKVDISHIRRVHGASGIVFAAVRNDGERMLYTSDGVASAFSKEDIPLEYIRHSKFVHMASIDSKHAVEAFEAATVAASEAGSKIIFDPGCIFAEKGIEAIRNVLRHCFVLKLNKVEARMFTGSDDEDAAKKLIQTGAEKVIITKGLDGCIVWDNDGVRKIPFIPKVKVKPLDLTGAGDSFSAGFLSALLDEKDFDEAVKFAMHIGSLSTGVKGARGTPMKNDVNW